MGCCCKKNDRDTNVKKQKCCVCNPFGRDGFLLTAQIASILATSISWVWWPTFLLSATIVSTLQVTWCCQMKKPGLYSIIIMSIVAFALSLFTGIWMITKCWEVYLFIGSPYDDSYDHRYGTTRCSGSFDGGGNVLGSVALVDAALFLLVAVSTLYFVRARYDAIMSKQVEEEAQEETYVQRVEMTVADLASIPEATATAVSPDTKPGLDYW